jgi:hypothetical protein
VILGGVTELAIEGGHRDVEGFGWPYQLSSQTSLMRCSRPTAAPG